MLRNLIEIENTKWILSPIRIEFLCGVRDSDELKLYCAYLEQFEVLDERRIPSRDWSEAERLAQWVKEGGRARKLGDCLIQAIAKRLHAEVTTAGIRNFRKGLLQNNSMRLCADSGRHFAALPRYTAP